MEGAFINMKLIIGNRESGTGNWFLVPYLRKRVGYIKTIDREQGIGNREPGTSSLFLTRGYQKVLSLTWKEPEIWIYSALFFNVVPFQLHTLVPSSFPVISTRSVEVNILVP